MPEGNRWRPTAVRAADAMQPQLLQSGVPPNWQGVIGRCRSADTHCVTWAKMHSEGDEGGDRYTSNALSWTSSLGYAGGAQ